MRNIHRRKPVHSHSLPPLVELERKGYKEDIEKLKFDKESLNMELQRYKEGLKAQMRALSERVQNVENRHANMLSSLAETLHRPASSLQPERKRRFPGSSCLCAGDNQRQSSQNLSTDHLDADSLMALNNELVEHLDSSLMFWEKIVLDATENVMECSSCTSSYNQLAVEVGDTMNSGTSSNVRTGVNDAFWEQFLTENPGSNNSSEPQDENKVGDHGMYL